MTFRSLPVSRSGRAFDLRAAVFLICGGALYAYAYVGMERLRTAPDVAFARGMAISQLADFHRLTSLSRWGIGIIVTGVVCATVAWFLERRRQRRA